MFIIGKFALAYAIACELAISWHAWSIRKTKRWSSKTGLDRPGRGT